MTLVVQKYGGSSLADAGSIRRVASRVAATREAGHDVAVVVSAMGDTTDELLDLAHDITSNPTGRELDILLTAGERTSMALLAMGIQELGHEAVSFTGIQAGLRTTDQFGAAKILDVQPERVRDAMESGAIAIVAGFQGVSREDEVTTLGRGGSDTTAVALAAALDADRCEICTDVDGLYSADPRVVPDARRMSVLSTEEALELSAHGAKVLHLRSVELARRYDVPLHVRSSFSDREGTWVTDDPRMGPSDHHPTSTDSHPDREDTVEEAVIRGLAHSLDQCKLTVVGVPDVQGSAAATFAVISEAVASLDMTGQTHTAEDTGTIDFSFAMPIDDGRRAVEALRAAQDRLGFEHVRFTEDVGKVSIVGAGMRSSPEVPARLFHALGAAGITIHLISTSEIRLSVVVDGDQVEEATRVLHSAFDLESTDGEEALVHAGTGR